MRKAIIFLLLVASLDDLLQKVLVQVRGEYAIVLGMFQSFQFVPSNTLHLCCVDLTEKIRIYLIYHFY